MSPKSFNRRRRVTFWSLREPQLVYWFVTVGTSVRTSIGLVEYVVESGSPTVTSHTPTIHLLVRPVPDE